MAIRFPTPLRPGDRVGVTSPSMGVGQREHARLEHAVAAVRGRGHEVVLGACMDGSSHVSAPAAERAAELMTMLTDPSIRAVVPPRGGETAIDLLPLLDWGAIAAAEPTWFIGFSDISTLLLPMTLRTGIATLHTNNLMNTPYRVRGPLLTWLDVAALPAGSSFTQSSPGAQRATAWPDYAANRQLAGLNAGQGAWVRLDDDRAVDVTGRLIGGCIETVRHLAGTPYGDVARFGHEHAQEGLIVYVEAAGDDAFAVCRSLHGMRLAGFFAGARAVLVARTLAPDSSTLTQQEAVLDALGGLGVPIIADVGCGHVPPYLPIVNGALGRLRFGTGSASLTQYLS
jgi:muramoyltetrapeptide carboxypeptidase LdcA involved in peptidoglycan recycling